MTDWSIEGAFGAMTGSVEQFAKHTRALLKNPLARLALTGTALFCGAGAALRFLLIAWVPAAHKVTNNRSPTFLTAMVAAGVGFAVAVQNLFENMSMFALVSGYTAVAFLRVPVNEMAVGFGLFLAASMGGLNFMRRHPLKD